MGCDKDRPPLMMKYGRLVQLASTITKPNARVTLSFSINPEIKFPSDTQSWENKWPLSNIKKIVWVDENLAANVTHINNHRQINELRARARGSTYQINEMTSSWEILEEYFRVLLAVWAFDLTHTLAFYRNAKTESAHLHRSFLFMMELTKSMTDDVLS